MRVDDRGFTILELLVAMILLSLLVVGLAGTMRVGLGQWSAVEARARAAQPVAAVQAMLRRTLGAALAAPTTSAPGAPVAFAGGVDAVDFVGAMPPRASAPGLNRIALSLDHARGELALGWRSVSGAAAGDRKTLLEGVRAAEFAYFGSPDGTSPAAWFDHWGGSAPPPRLVRLRLAFTDARQSWPDLMIAIGSMPDTPPPADPLAVPPPQGKG